MISLPQDAISVEEIFDPSVIEYLNYDPQSGHDTCDQKVLFKGHIDLNEIFTNVCLIS